MNHETSPDPATVQADVTTEHKLHRDYETRGRADLREVGAALYARDPTTEIICISYAIDGDPVQRWFPGDPVPQIWLEAAENPTWVAVAHNDAFESAIEEHILHPRYGFPLISADRHRCTQAAAHALGLPAKLGLLADALEFTHRKDAAGERLMHQMSKPRKARFGEDPEGTYWHEEPDQIARLSDYCCWDVECEREADDRVPPLSAAEQAAWVLSNKINNRGFHVDRKFAVAARKIAREAAPEFDAEIAEITFGAVTAINQVQKMKDWLATQGCVADSLGRKKLEKLLEDDELPASVRRLLELRLGGAQAATKKIDALIARASSGDDRIRGAFVFHGASTGRWSGSGFQPQNLKRPTVEDLDAAAAAVATGDYAYMKTLFPKPLSVVGDCTRQMIIAAHLHSLMGGDFGAIESRVLAWIAGETWKLDAYRRFDATKDPRDEPYVQTAVKVLRLNSPDAVTKAQRKIGKICDLAFGYMGALGAWRNFEPDQYSDAEVEVFKNEWRASHPNIVKFWSDIDRAAVKAVRERGEVISCGPVLLRSSGSFLQIKLPSVRRLSYPFPRIIQDDRGRHRVVFDDNAQGKFVACRGGQGAYGGTWCENVVSGIARDLLVEALHRVEAAGYPIVMHIHDEIVCEVADGFGSQEEFTALMTRNPSWAPDLPIAASAWSGPRYCK